MTKLRLRIHGQKGHIVVESEPFSIRMKEGVFAVTAPMFDDWLQTIDFDLRNVDSVITIGSEGPEIEFPDEKARNLFCEWLSNTNEQARKGYSTMWP